LKRVLALGLFFLFLVLPAHAAAHPLGFAVVSIDELTPGQADVVARVSGTESEPGRIAIEWPNGCDERVLVDAVEDEVRERRTHVRCDGGLLDRSFEVRGPARGLEVLVRIALRDRAPTRQVVRSLPARIAVGARLSTSSIATSQIRLGSEHFAFGLDHVLFVIGAFFLARRRGVRAVALAVTAFTIGHAITLALATLGGVTLAARPVEACIALSLVHVARELRVEKDTITRRTPALACALFGLVHGAGLARAMSGAGLTGLDLGLAALSFNVGLELAELVLVLVLVLVVRGRVVSVAERFAPLVVGGVGAWLLLDRLL